jgi:hypothetical protein
MKHVDEKYRYSELTSKIIGCAMKVRNILGNGFQKIKYQSPSWNQMNQSSRH